MVPGDRIFPTSFRREKADAGDVQYSCAIRVGLASQTEEIRQGYIPRSRRKLQSYLYNFVQSRSPASRVSADVTLESLAANALAAQGLAELVAIRIRSTFFLPKLTAPRLSGSWSHKR
jgi:hypothetical protein